MPSIALIGIPLDENSSFLRGAGEAPPLIRQAFYSNASNMWTESGIDLGQEGVIFDAGDLAFDGTRNAFEQIEESVGDILRRGFRPIVLGGDHSITYPVIKAFRGRYCELSILHFDAHPDLYRDFEGNRFSHASPFARIMEEGLVRRLAQAGIRTMNGHQREQARTFGVEVVEMKDWRDGLSFRFETPIYVSIDLDALDPAFAPGVSHREPGGLTTRQIISTIQSLDAEVVGADIVELNPRQDPSGLSSAVCAKLLKELAGKMLEGRM